MSVQLIPVTQRKARRFTPQQKLQILKEWELTGNGLEVAKKHQIHPMTLYRWSKALKQGAQSFFEWQASQKRCPQQRTGGRDPQSERRTGVPEPGTHVVKKRDELGLMNRRKGATYSGTQRVRIIDRVDRLKASGVIISKTLKSIGVCRSSYYEWQKRHDDPPRKLSFQRLMGLLSVMRSLSRKRQIPS